MYTVDNKYEIGEECFSVYRQAIHYDCPVCHGIGDFPYKDYRIPCKVCHGSGKLLNRKQTVMAVCKVRIKGIRMTILEHLVGIKYNVESCDDDDHVNVRNRSETSLFKTAKEAEEYCVKCNTGECGAAF